MNEATLKNINDEIDLDSKKLAMLKEKVERSNKKMVGLITNTNY